MCMIAETNFHGRGHPGNRAGDYMMMAEPGYAYCISIQYGGHWFVWGFSRLLQLTPWGLHVTNAFRRCSSPGFESTWAECFAAEAWIYRAAIIQLIPEQSWMKMPRP